MKRHDVKNGIAVHAWNEQNRVDWEAAKVKQVETNYSRKRTVEAIHIHQQRKTSTVVASSALCGTPCSEQSQPLLQLPTNYILIITL